MSTTNTSTTGTTSTSSNGSGAQDYFSFQPDFQPNFHVRERPIRHTTITTRELRFPGGCDCHPTNANIGGELRRIESVNYGGAIQWRAHGRPEYISRTDSTDSRSSSRSGSSGSTSFFNSLFRRTSS